MSDTYLSTGYQIYVSVGDANAQDGFTINLDGNSGADDQSVLALGAAIKGVQWPTGITSTVSIIKSADRSVVSTGDLTADPPTFN